MDFALSPEQADIKKAARDFAQGEFTSERAIECELAHAFPTDLFRKAAQLGFVGLDYPEEIGGGGLGITENVLTIEEFCKADSGIGMAIHLAFLPAKFVRILGTDEQRKTYLEPLTRGEHISAVSFTEPDHGSDLTRMATTMKEKGDRFVVNGTKIFTTNASNADFVVVLCQDDLDAKPGRGMTTLLVDTGPSTWLGGELEIKDIPNKMGLKMTSSGELVFHDLEVPSSSLLGERGAGLANVLAFLDESRAEISAQALGNAEGAFLKAVEHAKGREQFGKPLIDFQGIGHKLARTWGQIQSMKWMTYHAAWLIDQKSSKTASAVPLYSSAVKQYVPQTAKAVIDEAMAVFGGYGYFLEQDVERRYRDNRIVEVYEGTVEVQLNNIVRLLKKIPAEVLKTRYV